MGSTEDFLRLNRSIFCWRMRREGWTYKMIGYFHDISAKRAREVVLKHQEKLDAGDAQVQGHLFESFMRRML